MEMVEITHYQQFLLFPESFQKICTVDTGLFGKGLKGQQPARGKSKRKTIKMQAILIDNLSKHKYYYELDTYRVTVRFAKIL